MLRSTANITQARMTIGIRLIVESPSGDGIRVVRSRPLTVATAIVGARARSLKQSICPFRLLHKDSCGVVPGVPKLRTVCPGVYNRDPEKN